MHTLRTVYFFLKASPLQFKVCAIFQLSIDFGKVFYWRSSSQIESFIMIILSHSLPKIHLWRERTYHSVI